MCIRDRDKSFRNWNIEKHLKNIKCQSLIIQGEEDEYGTLKQVDSIVNQISGQASKSIIPKIGHSPHKENREMTINECVKFINSIKLNQLVDNVKK